MVPAQAFSLLRVTSPFLFFGDLENKPCELNSHASSSSSLPRQKMISLTRDHPAMRFNRNFIKTVEARGYSLTGPHNSYAVSWALVADWHILYYIPLQQDLHASLPHFSDPNPPTDHDCFAILSMPEPAVLRCWIHQHYRALALLVAELSAQPTTFMVSESGRQVAMQHWRSAPEYASDEGQMLQKAANAVVLYEYACIAEQESRTPS